MTSIGSLLCVHMSGWSRAAPPSFLSQKKAFEKIHPLTSFSHLRFVGGTAAAPNPSLSLAHVSFLPSPAGCITLRELPTKHPASSRNITTYTYIHTQPQKQEREHDCTEHVYRGVEEPSTRATGWIARHCRCAICSNVQTGAKSSCPFLG